MATRTEQVSIKQALDNQRMVLTRMQEVAEKVPSVRKTGDWSDAIAWALATYRNLCELLANSNPVLVAQIGENDEALLAELEKEMAR
jgi:hypothetical protein